MLRLVLTEAQVPALVQELRSQDLSSKPALRDLLRRLERHTDRNRDDAAARYPTPPAESEGNQVDLGEKNVSCQTRRGRGRTAPSDSTSWRCDPQDPSPSSTSQPHELVGVPMQSVFALDAAGAAARATIKHFESRHPQVLLNTVAVDVEQREHHAHTLVGIKIEDRAEECAMVHVETPGLTGRKSKRRRTTRVE